MAFNKRTWLGRQGTGLNKFSIDGASPVTIVNQPDSVTQVGDALSAGNLNDLEDRIEDAFDDVDTALGSKADETEVTNLNNAINQLDHRVENLEQAKGDYIVASYKDGSVTPSGKGAWAVVEGVEGVSRVENNLIQNGNFDGTTNWSSVNTSLTTFTVTNNVATVTMKADVPATGQYNYGIRQTFGKTIAGHKYLIRSRVKSEGTGLLYDFDNSSTGKSITLTPNVWTDFIVLTEGVASNSGVFYIIPDEGLLTGQSFQATGVVICDLTLYFGGTIPSDADTIAEIQTNYPHLLTPSEYGTRIVDSSYSGVRAWARNLAKTNPTFFDSPYIPTFDADKCYKVTAGVTYYWKIFEKTFTTYRARLFFYDMEGNPLTTPSTSWVTEVSSNGFYVNGQGLLWGGNASDTTKKWTFSQDFYILFVFTLGDTSASSVISKFCFNVTDANDGTYTPYHAPNTLSFPSTSLKSAGSVRDTLELNVEVNGVAKKRETQRILEIDLGADCTWTWQGASTRFASNAISAMKIYPNARTQPFECTKYVAVTDGRGFDEVGDMSVYTGGGNLLYIVDSTLSASDIDSNGKIQKLVGVKLTFELAAYVVTLSDPIIDNTLLTEAYGRMSTVQTGTIVDGIADLGFITL